MPPQPLTHHEILTLVEPFTRRGIHPDLPASNRLERRLVFKQVPRPLDLAEAPPCVETLQLETVKGQTYRLTRTLVCPAGSPDCLSAHLVAEGDDPGNLLARIGAIAPERHFRVGARSLVAKSFRLPDAGQPGFEDGAAAPLVLTHMAAQVAGLSVTFSAPTIKADPDGRIALRPGRDGVVALPDDLLAVLGRDWALLKRSADGWTSRLRLRGREPRRSGRMEPQLDEMVAHVAQTLADTPARFHERLVAARWRVVLRRIVPLSVAILLVVGAFGASYIPIAEDSSWRMLLFNAPPLLLVCVFCLRDIPIIEVPPFPRRSTAADWRDTSRASPLASPHVR